MDLSLYLVTARKEGSLEAFLKIIEDAIDGGVTIVQLREKNADTKDFIEIGSRLLKLLRPRKIPLIINDNLEVAVAIGADGLHLGQSDLSIERARTVLGKDQILGLSVETMDQALAANRIDVDYVAASPLFATPTKTDTAAPWGIEGLKALCCLSKHPVVAIGGIDASNASEVFAAGAAGIAVVSAIFNAPFPKMAARQLKECYANHRVG